MKKLLALVLALVMSMSLVTISNAAFKDADKIDYKEAVDVMNAVGVFIGDEKGNFNAKENLTREQAAKIIGNTVTLFMVGSVVLAAALVGQLRPAAVVCVDSLCSAEGQRLGRTVQFSDSGLYPAQADHTRHLTRDTLGVPVVAAGIPTLMQAQEGADLVVTPRALDSVIAHGAALLAGSVNRALQPRLTVQQLCWLTG